MRSACFPRCPLARPPSCNILRGTRNAAGTACSGELVVVDRDGKALITLPANTATMVPAVALYTGQALQQ